MKTYFISLCFFIWLGAFGQGPVDVINYHFEIELSDQSDAITGKAKIEVSFLQPCSEINFDLVSVDGEKGMYAYSVTEMDQPVRYIHSNDLIHIYLSRPAKAGEKRSYTIEYMGTPKDGLIISKNKFGDRTFFSDNWPNRAHNWIPCVDRPDDKASFEFLVKAPEHYRVVSNGIKISESMEGPNKLTFWRESTALPTKVMVIGVADFAVRQFADSPDSIPVSAWVFPEDSTKGFYDYALAPAILKYFSSYIAPYPYKKLANVQSKTIFGGMENASAIFYAEGSVTGDRKWEEVYAHEIAHQWFGDMASEKSFAHLWLSEGFATYLTDIYFENKYGEQAFIQRMQKERADVIAFVLKNERPVVDTTTDLMSLLNANSYQKGAWTLHMLRLELGEEVFHQVIRSYYAKYAGGNADSRDFEQVAEQVSGKDLGWFFGQWLYRAGIPELGIRVNMEDKLKIRVVQMKEVYRFTLEVGVKWEDGGYSVEKVQVDGKETEFEMKGRKAVSVVIDPGVKLLFSQEKR